MVVTYTDAANSRVTDWSIAEVSKRLLSRDWLRGKGAAEAHATASRRRLDPCAYAATI